MLYLIVQIFSYIYIIKNFGSINMKFESPTNKSLEF